MMAADGDLPAVEVTIVTYQRGPSRARWRGCAQAGVAVATVAERRRWDMKVFPQLKQVIAPSIPTSSKRAM